MHIAIDLDDVILDFVGNLTSILNTEYDAGLTMDDIVDWDLKPVLDEIVGEDWWKWWERRDWLWALAPAVPGAIGSIEKLRRSGHYIEVVTAKPQWAEAQTWRWLGKWRPPVQRVTIVGLTDRKLDATSAELLIDDRVPTVQEWHANGRRALVFARPHNKREREQKDMEEWTVYGWKQTVKTIEELPSQDRRKGMHSV